MSEIHSWKIRRRFMFVTVAFCMLVVVLTLLFRPDTSVANTVITMAFGTITAVLSSYVFGAVWDDKNRSK